MLEIRSLSKTYANGVQALKDVTLDVPRGMFGSVSVETVTDKAKPPLVSCTAETTVAFALPFASCGGGCSNRYLHI